MCEYPTESFEYRSEFWETIPKNLKLPGLLTSLLSVSGTGRGGGGVSPDTAPVIFEAFEDLLLNVVLFSQKRKTDEQTERVAKINSVFSLTTYKITFDGRTKKKMFSKIEKHQRCQNEPKNKRDELD